MGWKGKCRAPVAVLMLWMALGANSVRAADFYIATNGTFIGDGSITNPWDVYTAFNQPASVQPGDTLWLRGGIYIPEDPSWPSIECYIQGTPSAPIIVRQYPGERAIFQEVPYPQYTGIYDQDVLYMDSGGYVWFWDFELRSTNTTRCTTVTGSDPTPTELPIPNSVNITAPGVKLINMIIHDCRGGVGMFVGATDGEVYGCLIYNNGWDAPDRGHGHALYVQNQNGLMTLSDNILFNQFGLGIHGYTVGSYEQNYLVENNVIFNNGAIGQYPDANVGEQILFGNVPISNLNIISNYIYQPFGVYSSLLQLDYALVDNTTGVVAGNYIAGGCTEGQYAIYANNYQSMIVTGNTVYANGYMLDMINNASSESDHNTYYGTSGDNFNNDTSAYTFSGWQSATGYDRHSTYNVNVTPPNQIIVNPNAFEAKRANIIVYNWAGSNSVNVNVSNVLSPGDNFEIMNAQNWFGPPVLVGTYNGSSISLPMTNLTTVAPNGVPNSCTPTNAIPITGTQFNVFVIIGSNGCLNGATIFGQPTNQTVYAGSNATFTVQASGSPTLLYQWQSSVNNGTTWIPLAVATNASYTTSALATNNSGTQFRAIVSGTCGSPVTSSVAVVTVTMKPVASSAFAQAVVNDEPFAFWQLNETNGATVAYDFFDVYNGTIGPAVTAGVSGPQSPMFQGFQTTNTAMQLPGGAGSVLTMPTLNLDSAAVTITGWMNPSGNQSGWAGVVFCRGGSTVSGVNFGPGSPANELRFTWNNNQFSVSTGLIVPTNQWSFFALVVTPTGGTVYLGTNGVLNSVTESATLTSSAFDAPLLLGEDPSSGGRYYAGALDEVAIFNQSLSPAQIQQLYSNALVAPLPPAPVASFTNNPASGPAPLTVDFYDTSINSPTNWSWTFGDGSGTSTLPNPSHTYDYPGSYVVTQIVANASGASTNTGTISVSPFTFAQWQQVYGLTGTLSGGNACYTGDGMSNTNKFMAGFNPTNSAAYLHIINIANANTNDIKVTYLGANGDSTYVPGIASRTNVLDYTTGDANGDYTNGAWQDTCQTNILSGGNGSGIVTNMVDSGGATNGPSRYYRVRVLLP